MILEIPRENIDKILDRGKGESSESMRAKVINARKIQQTRFAGTGIFSNAQMGPKQLEQYITLDEQSKSFLSEASRKLILSPRVVHRTIKLARTIADMEGAVEITVQHLAEAMQYRSRTMFVEME